ncbi:MAG: bifunctional precorrin-2 dehydrogenase/sirohydrochlorin ferrochelatase [Deltaproteobacteria bacterium]|nr:bifunctional precorrin-2 dehydrogenase/sirohydrochlorin ferrochelatase [Deltaproteobacteria bacterium]
MGYVPIFLEVRGRQCIVIGGGESAEAKVRGLLDAGAIVTVISADLAEEIKSLARAGQLRYVAREYEYGDLRGNVLAYVTLASNEVVCRVAGEARELGIPLNVADRPEYSTFISPARLRRGDLEIAISTSGSSPALARMLRERLEQQIGPRYGAILEIMRRARQLLRRREPDQRLRASVLKSLAASLMDSADVLDYDRVEQLLRLHLKSSVVELGLELQSGLPAKDNGE